MDECVVDASPEHKTEEKQKKKLKRKRVLAKSDVSDGRLSE